MCSSKVGSCKCCVVPKHDSESNNVLLLSSDTLWTAGVCIAKQTKMQANRQANAWKQLCRTSSGCLLISFLTVQLLTEMDGFDSEEGVLVLAATNRAEVRNGLLQLRSFVILLGGQIIVQVSS